MKKIRIEKKLCLVCMEEHDVDIVEIVDHEIFKNVEVEFTSTYEYCSIADEYLENEDMIKANALAMKDAYRKKMKLMTSNELIDLRKKYEISQKDLSKILGWGEATISRYEKTQVQDCAHDNVLKKISSDSKWFMDILKLSKSRLSDKAYNKYYRNICNDCVNLSNEYLQNSIYCRYLKFNIKDTGGIELNLDKVVEMINYFAKKIESLHKVKLMKVLWYADFLSYKRFGHAISGLVYSAFPMGALPEEHEKIILLDGVKFKEIPYEKGTGYKFECSENFEVELLSDEEITVLDDIIANFGEYNSKQIIDKMHEEDGYKCTDGYCLIPYDYAENLSIV